MYILTTPQKNYLNKMLNDANFIKYNILPSILKNLTLIAETNLYTERDRMLLNTLIIEQYENYKLTEK